MRIPHLTQPRNTEENKGVNSFLRNLLILYNYRFVKIQNIFSTEYFRILQPYYFNDEIKLLNNNTKYTFV